MYPYTMTQWLFLFYFYCFLGWCVEATYVSLKEKPPHWINRGFIRSDHDAGGIRAFSA